MCTLTQQEFYPQLQSQSLVPRVTGKSLFSRAEHPIAGELSPLQDSILNQVKILILCRVVFVQSNMYKCLSVPKHTSSTDHSVLLPKLPSCYHGSLYPLLQTQQSNSYVTSFLNLSCSLSPSLANVSPEVRFIDLNTISQL